MLFGKIFYMIHRTISVRFLRDTIRQICEEQENRHYLRLERSAYLFLYREQKKFLHFS